jgi:hypothetical protein
MSQHTTGLGAHPGQLTIAIMRDAVIQRGAAEIFATIQDFTIDPRWRRAVLEMRQEPAVTQVGTTTYERLRFLGQVYATEAVVTAYEPGRLLAFRATSSSVPLAGQRRLEPLTRHATRVILQIEFTLAPSQRLLGLLLRWGYGRQMDADLRCLARLVERPVR